jgi:ATP synthase protein I
MSGRDGEPARKPEESELSDRLRTLGQRLDEQRPAGEERAREAPPSRAGYALAMRLAADFVAGIVVGAALGWGIDRLFGIAPWGLVVCLLLGFAAGILSVLRTAGLAKPGPAGPDKIGDRF